jgi:hypothetical protein
VTDPAPDALEADLLGLEGVTRLVAPVHDDGTAVEIHLGARYGTTLADLGEQVADLVTRQRPGRTVRVHVDDVA